MTVLKWALAAWMTCAGVAMADRLDHGIIVTGEGRISVAPDMATITLGVTETADTAKAAMDRVASGVAAILARLDALGVLAADRQTSRFYVRPVHAATNPDRDDPTPPMVIGYEAGNSVLVTVRDLDALGGMLDAVIETGANDLDGLGFDIADRSGALAQARKAAVADAQTRAAQLAEAAGLTLGTVLWMSESSSGAPMMAMDMGAARGLMQNGIAAGEITIEAQVTMGYNIAPVR